MTDPMQRLEEIITELFMADSNSGSNEDAVAEAKADLLALYKETARAEMLEMVGEDEEQDKPITTLDGGLSNLGAHYRRNQFRAQLRQQITKRYGTEG